MMAENPSNLWNILPSSLSPSSIVLGSSSLPLNSMAESHHNSELPSSHSWSQLLQNGLSEGDEEDRLGLNNHFQPKKMENLEGRILIPFPRFPVNDQEVSQRSNNNLSLFRNEELISINSPKKPAANSSPSSSSLTSCFRSNSILDFSYNKVDSRNQCPDPSFSSETTSSSATGVCKKARVQATSGQPPFKVRKEKVGDRITALHQLVSPFGKTDTASVLSEAIGYVRFLQGQIEALISPYLGRSSSKSTNSEQFGQAERRTSVFPEDPGQLLNDSSLKRKLAPYQDSEDEPKNLRRIGLCLVPVSCTQHVECDINGADYWAQAYNGSF